MDEDKELTPEELEQLKREQLLVESLARQQRKEQKEDYDGYNYPWNNKII